MIFLYSGSFVALFLILDVFVLHNMLPVWVYIPVGILAYGIGTKFESGGK